MARPQQLNRTRQFLAVLRKNLVLQTRSRKSLLGVGGWAGLLLQLLLPVAFFFVMYLPKYYIKPISHGETLGWAPVQLESRSWAQPYDGPATFKSHGGRARLLLAPDTPPVRGLARVLARGLACPRDPALRLCPAPNLPANFHCMFMPPLPVPPPGAAEAEAAAAEAGVEGGLAARLAAALGLRSRGGGGAAAVKGGAGGGGGDEEDVRVVEGRYRQRRRPAAVLAAAERAAAAANDVYVGAQGLAAAGSAVGGGRFKEGAVGVDPCADFATCVATPACYEHVLVRQIDFMPSAEAARANVSADPDVYDALLYFPEAAEPHHTGTDTDTSDASDTDPDSSSLSTFASRLLNAASPGSLFSTSSAASSSASSLLPGAAPSPPPAGPPAPRDLLRRSVMGMNHTDVPPTRFLLDLFEVVPTRGNGLSLYRRYWFFANLQLAVQRAVMGLRIAAAPKPPPPPVPSPAPPPPAHPPSPRPSPTPPVHPPAPTAPNMPPAAPEGVEEEEQGEGAVGWGYGKHVLGGSRRRAAAEGPGPSDGGGERGGTAPDGDGTATASVYDDAVPANVQVSYKAFPWPAVTEDLGAASAAVFFNLLLVYAFLAPTRAVVGDIVREKELRLREGMRMLGLTEPSYWASWALTHWALLALSGALCAAAGTYPFANSNVWLMLAFFWLYAAALVAYSYCMSTLFASSRVAGTASQLVYALSMLPGFIMPVVYQYGSWTWYAACLAPPSAASLFANVLINWEMVAEGITLRTLWTPISSANGFCAASVLWLLALDVLLYGSLTWYLDKVLPKSYGQRLPWWFPFDRRYWGVERGAGAGAGARKLAASSGDGVTVPLLAPGDEESQHPSPQRSPHPSPSRGPSGGGAGPGGNGAAGPGGDVAVCVRGLVRTFPSTSGGPPKVAVDHLDLQIERGRITALLGHNGAGKTTTIHILTGMLQPSSGRAWVNGFDTATQMDQVRASLGICPQFDILWPDLTVAEHLQLYLAIKGYDPADVPAAAEAAAASVGLGPKLQAAAGELSGGQRRKLSVAIAFLGNPAVVFLDEPTSGMDPYSRRFTWDVIRQHRADSAIVLTTHSMEEADLLGDRVAILARGRLAAQGTGMELKAAHGVGYNLTLVMDPNHPNQRQGSTLPPSPHPAAAPGPRVSASGGAAAGGGAGAVVAAVRLHVPSAELLSAAGSEVVLRLPREAAAAFPPLLRELEGPLGRQGLGVASYGLSLTTLEEVFLSITAAAEAAAAAEQDGLGPGPASAVPTSLGTPPRRRSDPGSPAAAARISTSGGAASPPPPPPLPPPLRGWRLYGQQLRALLAKRVLCARRDRLALVTQLAVPLALVALALYIGSLQVREPSEPPLELSRSAALMDRPLGLSAAPGARNATAGCPGGGGGGGGEGGSTGAWALALRGLGLTGGAGGGGEGLGAGGESGAGAGGVAGVGGCLAAFLAGHPARVAAGIVDSGSTALFTGDVKTRKATLEDYLLRRWYVGGSGSPLYDSIHLTSLPPPSALAVGGAASAAAAAAAAAAPPLAFVLLTNQSAVSALPAALTDAMSAAMSYIDLALPGPFISQPPPSAAALSTSSPSHPARRLAASSSPSSAPSGPFAFSSVSWPLPTLPTEPVVRVQRDAASLMLVLCMVLASAVLSASFVVFVVREQDNNSKHLQLVSGAPPSAYWAANYAWDLTSYALSGAGLVGLIAAYRLPQYSGKRLAATAGLLGGFGPAGLSLTYLAHFAFRDEMRALQRLNTAYFLTGYLGFVVTWIIDLIMLIVPPSALGRLGTIHAWTKALLRTFSPHYCFAKGVYDVGATYNTGFPFFSRGQPFDWDVFGCPMAHMAVQAVLYGAIALAYDMGLFATARARLQDLIAGRGWLGSGPRRAGSPLGVALVEEGARAAGRQGGGGAQGHGEEEQEEDEDVAEERVAVEEGLRDGCPVLLQGVRKAYRQGLFRPPVPAVRGLWLGVPQGECFGLLGVNGAGKTTTFRILTGEVPPDAGDARVGGASVRTQRSAARRRLGYCPQFEALPGAMTGREVATMYARLRGVPEPSVPALVADLLGRLGLERAADQACGGYSGGMKRKLGVAVALVGDPRVTALDEPSTGMDPGARRGLWSCLQSEVIRAGRTVLLTSHSMEECEALCSRLTIMAGGRLRCLGTPQHLKGRFGGGYLLEVKTLPRSASSATLLPLPAPTSTAFAAAAGAPTAASPTPDAPPEAGAGPGSAEAVAQWLAAVCPGAALQEVDQNRLTFAIPRGSADLAALFEAVEGGRARMGLVDYALSQTTLERVFVAMAAEAAGEEDAAHAHPHPHPHAHAHPHAHPHGAHF
ncbi:hypothetical protein HYH03_017700 [Edaphochlamys debaryana]|uniref:ABC transporter domain-containing protein n=1 Tax=Edaphochlamys debaryana TaxID=47281 RepID=A0A836BNN1_9CHLO|nr:hypothetical protein HYH03_017700 [Edaphochlamys debaryana]|eukprot:KAG2483446.1 hypothetical protein HYH03_017700 [Edaphochlamys debaryana]